MAPTKEDTKPQDLKSNIEELRRLFDLENEKNKQDYDESDAQMLREDDRLCERYLSPNGNVADKALEQVKEAFKWKKHFGVHGIKESNLSQELLKEGGVHPYNHDKEGNPVLMFLVKQHKKDAEKTDDQRRFIVYWVDKLLRGSTNHKISVVYDCIDSSYSNMDLEMTMFITHLFIKYYPSSLGYLIVYDMPWLFNAIWKVIKPLLPKHSRDKVKFVDKNSVREFIDPKYLPVRMGGQDTSVYVYQPTVKEDAKEAASS